MRILIIEDDKKQCWLLQFQLEKEGYSADTCNDGGDAEYYLSQNAYDIVLLDRMLPHKDGMSILRDMRRRGDHTPVIMLTALGELDDKISGLDCGADDYLVKPFEIGELLARIRAMTRRKGIIADINPKYGDITLDIKRGELICNGNSVVLGRKEFQMMEMLISNAGQIITKELFVKKIWGYDDDTEYNNVEVYISFLRKKLTMLHSNVQIKTRRSIGYCLDGAK